MFPIKNFLNIAKHLCKSMYNVASGFWLTGNFILPFFFFFFFDFGFFLKIWASSMNLYSY